MKTSTKLFAVAIALSTLGLGCKDDEKAAQDFSQGDIKSGIFTSKRCFKNRIETEAALGADRFSNAQITINDNRTGSGHYDVFSDANCATALSSRSFTFTAISEINIGGANVLKLDQDGTVLNPTWYIPTVANAGGYSMDVDFTDGESGPYITEPSPTQLSSWLANQGQGVQFDKN